MKTPYGTILLRLTPHKSFTTSSAASMWTLFSIWTQSMTPTWIGWQPKPLLSSMRVKTTWLPRCWLVFSHILINMMVCRSMLNSLSTISPLPTKREPSALKRSSWILESLALPFQLEAHQSHSQRPIHTGYLRIWEIHSLEPMIWLSQTMTNT